MPTCPFQRLALLLLMLVGVGFLIVAAAADGSRYVRTTPRFHAPQGPHDWLNKTSFVGTITPSPQGGAVIIRAFKVL